MTVPDDRVDTPDDDHTMVVDRSPEQPDLDDGTVVVDRDTPEPADHTVVVDRPLEPADEGTVVVDRSGAEPEDGTIVVDRSEADPDDGTIIVGGAESDGTIVVDRGSGSTPAAASAAPDQPQGSRSRRRRITLPPVEEGFAPVAVEAVGPGAVSSYLARPIAQEPPPVIPAELGPEATRAAAPSMPSVVRRSRRMSLIGVVGFLVAVGVSVTGLTAIGFALFAG